MNLWYSLYAVIGIVGFLAVAFLGELIADVINQLRKGNRLQQEGGDD